MNKHLPQKLLLSTIICCLLLGITQLVNAQAKTWLGLTNNWNLATNWNPGGVPGSGNNVTIPAVGGTILFAPKLSANANCGTITFSGSTTISSATGAEVLSVGSSITINSGISATISTNVALTVATTFNVSASTSSLLVSGIVSGSSAITKTGTGVLTLSALNTFTDIVTVSSGTLRLGASSSGANSPLGNQSSGTSVTSGGVLDLNGFTISNTEALSLTGSGYLGNGTLTNSTGVQAFYTAPVVLTGNTGIGVVNAPINLNNITGAFTVTKIGVGDLIFGSGISTLNALAINAGLVKANNNLLFTATSTSLTVNAGTLDMGTFALTVSSSYVGGAATGQVLTSNTGTTPLTANLNWSPLVNYNNASGGQTLVAGSFPGGMQLSNSSGTQTASGNVVAVSGLNITGNTILQMAGFQLSGTTITTLTGAIIEMGAGDITFDDFTGLSGLVRFSGVANGKAIPAGTVEYNGASQTLGAGYYNNLIINESSGDATIDPYNPSGVNGTLTLTSGILNMGTDFSVNGGIVRTAGFLAGDQYSNLTLGGGSGNAAPLYFAPGSAIGFLTLSHTATATTTLNTDLSVYGGVNFGSVNDVLNFNSRHVTLISDGNGTAYIGQAFTPVSGATNVTAERFIGSGSRAWRLLTIPLTGVGTIRDAWAGGVAPNPNAALGGETTGNGTLITGNGFTSGAAANPSGFDWFTGLGSATTSSIRSYTSANGWTSVNTPSPISAPAEQGYMLYVRGDRTVADASSFGITTLRPTGTLKQGSQPFSIPTDPYVVVGNPYPGAIDIEAMYLNAGNSTKIARNFWIWDATLGSAGAFRVISWDGISAYNMTGGSGTPTDYLVANSGQAFFVQRTGGGILAIEESNKTTNVPQVLFRNAVPAKVKANKGTGSRPAQPADSGVSNLAIQLYTATTAGVPEKLLDGATARFNDIYTDGINNAFNAAKLNNFNENLGLFRSNKYLSIESRPFPTVTDTLFVPSWNLKQQNYALLFTPANFNGINQTAYLVDRFTSTQQIINLNGVATTYSFNVSSNPASSSTNRFIVVFAAAVPLPVTFIKIGVLLSNNDIMVSWNTATESGIKNYVIERSSNGTDFSQVGIVAAQNSPASAAYQWIDKTPAAGNNFYRIRSVDESGKTSYSSIALVSLDGKNGIQVAPTLITNRHFTLSLYGEAAGNYDLLLTNTAGQQVFHGVIKHLGGDNNREIDFGNTTFAAGIYNLSVSDVAGILHNFKLVIK